MESYKKTGYLNSEFRMFHLSDQGLKEFQYHYHDFNKIVIFIRGNASYCIEGKTYALEPYDIVLVNAGEIHKPVVHDNTTYERIIIYISPSFIDAYTTSSYNLNLCFAKANTEKSNVLRIDHIAQSKLYQVCQELEASFSDTNYAVELYQKILCLEFMIWLNRATISDHITYIETNYSNSKISQIIEYIHTHLKEEITIDTLANYLYINKHYLMHLFKSETGYTIGNYITSKRLLLVKDLIEHGMSITQACYECGYKNYSSFLRAYKKQYGQAPKSSKNL